MSNLVITIDGPAGSGKSTVAAKLANKLGFIHLNSGALFRIVGCIAHERAIALDDDEAVGELTRKLSFEFVVKGNSESGETKTELLVDGQSVAKRIATAQAGTFASHVALLPTVRKVLTEVQRQAIVQGSLVLEGRDAGTIVFPDASFKFYLDADSATRAKRRHAQLMEDAAGTDTTVPTLAELQQQIEQRDHRDATRELAPQVAAKDAILIDTSQRSIDEVIESICNVVGAA